MKRFVLPSFAVLCLVLTAAAQEKYTLKYQHVPGQYEMVQETVMDMTIGVSGTKATIPMKTVQTQYITLNVSEKQADGSQQIAMEITRIAMNQTSSIMNLKYDSAAPDAAESPLKAAGVAVGLKITATTDKDGKFIKVEGVDEFFEKLSNNPDYPKPVADMLKKQLTNESMTKTIDMSREITPKQPVAVGETWKSEGTSELPMFGKVKANLDNTLKEVKTIDGRKVAVILSKSEILSEKPQEIDTGNAGKMTFKTMNVESESTVLMDIASGWTTSTVSEIKMKIETAMEMNGKTLEQNMTGTGTTTVSVKPKTPAN
ncbi:MAG: DUF6263 family protein [Planctomycetaceae bacterium]|jgi:hypothetical protein|nr:DUF6263 family protein [Planctomycetaceae bacterium]